MESIDIILQKAISLGATDIHLAPNRLPVYRIKRSLVFDETKLPLTKIKLEQILNFFAEKIPNLKFST